MENHWISIWMLFSVIIPFSKPMDQASFYGGSYIAVPLKEAKSSTDIHFKFRTRLPNALLFLVAGSTDYCIIHLNKGFLKININLGAGEFELFPKQTQKLDDLKWHDVFIVRKEGDISMIIDSSFTERARVPGNFFELNINYGLFIGAIGNRTDLFFGHIENFRGCLAEVMYNGILVLDQARRRQSQATVHGVTWNCAAEFESPADRAISFVEDGAFLAMPHQSSHSLKLQLELKTLLEHSLIFYNAGPLSKQDLFALEIWKGKLKVMLKHGDRTTEMFHDEFVSDGVWHKLLLKLNVNNMDLTIDSKMKSMKILRGNYVDYSDIFYVGGIELSKRSRAIAKGLKTADNNFKGCLKHVVIDDHPKGMPDVRISEGLLPGCVWQYPCSWKPCENNGVCVQKGLDSYQCQCQDQSCSRNYTGSSKVYSHTNFATELELLAIKPLEVLEGQNALITTSNLHMILDYPKYGIKNFGIKFTVTEIPAHGSILIDVWPHEKNVFTLSDVARDKIHYIHDGTETQKDHFVLEIEFSASEHFTLPAYLQGKFRFTLAVNIAPVNDPPILKFSQGNVLRVPQGGKKTISSTLLQVTDPDSTAKQLIFTILDAGPGHFEYAHKSSASISTFSLQDVENHDVVYVHNMGLGNDSYITLQVSDGIERSQPGKMRVSAFPQFWRLKNNTGLVLMHFTSAVITPFNLTFISNVANASDTAQYHIIEGPQFGIVEVERDVGVWETTIMFSSDDLKQHRVRYRHVTSRPDYDEFQFRTTYNLSLSYTFRMSFAKCKLYSVNTNTLTLNQSNEVVLASANLRYQTDPVKTPTTSIIYQIVNAPLYGYLFSAVSKYKMHAQDSFTQEDVNLRNVKYKLFRKAYSSIIDSVYFNIVAPGCQNLTANLTIMHLPSALPNNIQIVIERLTVEEGSKNRISNAYIHIKSDFLKNIVFNITEEPQHGIIQVVTNNVVRNKSDHFTWSELQNNQVYYLHDDSETRQDSFKFMALSSEEEDFEYVDTFYIDIFLKNDNSPNRVIDKIFHVVVGGEKLLTADDLKYEDIDLDTKQSDITYTFRELPNGEFFSSNNPAAKLTEFTQQDLNSKSVLFKHRGPEYGKIKFWVTDGPYYVTGILEVQASAPFIRVLMNKRLVVQHGKAAVITSEVLNYNTNLFAVDEDVIYEVTQKSNFGKIVYTNTTKVLSEFTQADIKKGIVSYNNDITSSSADTINLKITCRDAVNVAQLSIWMLPASYWEPLQIKTCKTLSVEESTSAIIGKAVLEISQPDVPSSAIIYHIAEPPENGYLSILPTTQNSIEQSTNIRSFSQSLMNENRIIYIQSVVNETEDNITFNITNGMVWYNGLKLKIQIIPERLYLGSNALTVTEGGTSIITPTNIFVLTDYYKARITDYVMLENPKFGCIQLYNRCNKLHGFSSKEFLAGLVKYAHNGSENLEDSTVLIAVAGEKRSIPVILQINVLPVNDHKPKLVNNTGAVMWEGGVMVITKSMLGAIDADQPQEILKYQILSCWWGNVSLTNDPSTVLHYFTQDLVDRGMVSFRHQNGTEAKFTFNISDGIHSSKEYSFNIRTKPVTLNLRHKALHIFPLQRKFLTSTHLLATASDPERPIFYEVTSTPKLGRLMMESTKTPGLFNIINEFTQFDLNNSKVFYEHTHPFAGMYANDSFIFTVKSHLSQPLVNKKLVIDISVSSGGLDAFVSIPKMVVDEGGITNIILNFSGVISFLENHAGLRSPVIHAAATNPQHGQIFLQQSSNLTMFTQQQLESGQVQYQHDHSDSLGDNIYFSLYLIPGYIMLCNITVPVIVNPINDQPFKLITPAPHLTVVQGENRTITKNDLCTEDVDTVPSELYYDIITGPQEGRILLLPDNVQINHFTQADVDQNRLVYIHNSSALTDAFHFRVWDRKFPPEYTIFNIRVLPISINVSSGLPVYIQQGTNVVHLSNKQFVVETNTNRNKIQYKVREPPKHGVLYVKDNVAHSYNQDDLDGERVMYMQRDMTTANDSFNVFVGRTYGNVSIGKSVHLNVIVQPLMQIGNCTVLAGEYNKLSLHVLDATPLAKMTGSNPRYTITCFPQYGQVRKIIKSSGDHRNVLNTLVTSFTHEEVQSGLIYLSVNDIEVGWGGVMDKMCFVLASSIFQPALAELKIIIRSSLYNDIHSTLAGPNDPAGHEGGMHFASPNMTRDYFLIVSMVAGVIILGVALIIIIKCRSFEPEELNKDQCLQPIPLPRPPDRLMTSSPPLKHAADGYTSPIPAALPHCKVTPLGRNDVDNNPRYPYGPDEHSEDWSSCDTPDPSCPGRNNIMLRRNQYWV